MIVKPWRCRENENRTPLFFFSRGISSQPHPAPSFLTSSPLLSPPSANLSSSPTRRAKRGERTCPISPPLFISGSPAPTEGTYYICEGADVEFIGCCTSDPCADGGGICPWGDLRTSSFVQSKNEVIPSQNCDDSRGANIWYTCAYTNPPFFGCCDIYPCTTESGCPRSKILPSMLSPVEETRLLLLAPGKPKISGSVTSDANTSTPTSTPTSSVNRQSSAGAAWRTLSPGEVAGITVGVALLALIVLGLLLKAWWIPRRKNR